MDEFVKNILQSWGLGDQLLPIFEENCIDEEAFKILDVEAITSLIPKIGLRLKFVKHWEAEFKNSNPSVKERDTSANEIVYSDSFPVIDISDLGNILEQTDRDNIDNCSVQVNHPASYTSSVGSISDAEILFGHQKSSAFLALLKKSVKGIGVIKRHSLGHKFDQETRLALAEAIISIEILEYKDFRIPTPRLTELAELIETTFPPEKAATYYIPYKLNNITKQRVLAKGKLYDKYCAYRSFLRNSEVLSSKKRRIEVGKPIILGYRENLRSIEESEDVTVKIDWLKNCLEPWTTVEKYWQETAKHRINLLTTSTGLTSEEYMTEFKTLKQPLGLNLIKIDFSVVHPEKILSFYAKWPEFQERIVKYCFNAKNNDPSVKALLDLLPENILDQQSDERSVRITSDSLAVIALRLLPLLLPCPFIKSLIKVGKTKPSWRPTKAEVQNEFLLHVTSISELDTELSNRKKKHEKYGLTDQPIAIVVGDNLQAIEQCLVCVNTIKYRADSVLAAVDTTFQCFFALQLEYPREAELPWLVVQQEIFGITDETAKNIPSITTLINDLAHRTGS